MFDIKKMMGIGYYEVKALCNNCNVKWFIRIRKGLSIEEGLKSENCPQCGCGGLQQVK